MPDTLDAVPTSDDEHAVSIEMLDRENQRVPRDAVRKHRHRRTHGCMGRNVVSTRSAHLIEHMIKGEAANDTPVLVPASARTSSPAFSIASPGHFKQQPLLWIEGLRFTRRNSGRIGIHLV
jgi:hypothetical protein